MNQTTVILSYEGRFTWMEGESRQWMIRSHFIDQNGADRFKGNFSLEGLIALGIVPALRMQNQGAIQ